MGTITTVVVLKSLWWILPMLGAIGAIAISEHYEDDEME